MNLQDVLGYALTLVTIIGAFLWQDWNKKKYYRDQSKNDLKDLREELEKEIEKKLDQKYYDMELAHTNEKMDEMKTSIENIVFSIDSMKTQLTNEIKEFALYATNRKRN